MKASTTILMLLLLVVPAIARADDAPDYSPQAMLRLFSGEPLKTTKDDPLRFSYGVIDYRASRDTHLRFSPALLPLSGSEFKTTNVWPDPFALTGTQIATSPRAWRTQRKLNAELRRIDRLEKRAKVRVNPK